ncbi:helix-turn-helix domain-containing protein [Actinokineospora iranica]|uniref:Helix-turn-helix domain-containing protein n=1 Tax=Actinokineospora iranica TaxID=1271860 RepID=A0A1G6TN83_9PSEU|nr:helix-turn-helix transcriptional regulator [Actinokineospora iranica]SDD29847.1 Helix-turn-helix domain-containing protein [Actinokineospora iranica]
MTGRKGDSETEWPLGPWLKDARKALRLSQKQAAAKARFSRTAWQHLENGGRSDGRPVRPKSTTVISAALAVSANPLVALELAGLDPTAYEPARAGRPAGSVDEARDLLLLLNEPQLVAVTEMLRAFIDPRPLPTSSPTILERYRQGATLSEPEHQSDSRDTESEE